MQDWPTPATLFVRQAQGITLECADGLRYRDFCLGDTGAMFGHSPEPVARALKKQADRGLTCMLPTVSLPRIGALLAQTFGLPRWQLAMTASDANRFVLRWARAITQRPIVLVFDGCYHGAVDDTLVDLDLATGRSQPRSSLLGQVHNHHAFTRVVPFNDLSALEKALQDGQVAALLAEPALTNFGLVPPLPGYWEQVQALCQKYGSLLVMDETHTLSTGRGGYAVCHGLKPDFLVVGKAVAGGFPCAVYGFTEHTAQRMLDAKNQAPEGHSGIGTTLTGNALSLAALEAALDHLHTQEVYAHMLAVADYLEQGLTTAIQNAGHPWTITRIGARMELQFMPDAPRTAQDVRLRARPALEPLLHLFMLNRGVLLTPFHGMMLVSPDTSTQDIDHLVGVFQSFIREAFAAP